MKISIYSTLLVAALMMVSCRESETAAAREDAREEVREARQEAAEVRQEVREEVAEAKREVVDTATSSNESLHWKGNWNETKGKIKQRFADLTDDDLLYQEGKEEELLGRLQQRLGKTREEIEQILGNP